MTAPKEAEHCDYIHVHEDIVEQVNQNMPDEEILYDLAELFKLFKGAPAQFVTADGGDHIRFFAELCKMHRHIERRAAEISSPRIDVPENFADTYDGFHAVFLLRLTWLRE